ncbi:MAG: hypothetical protein F6K31_32695 [Symploca sp. SIO2G7]|nr:hypothetical protein [Symploca sp. SIO2G7]
MKKITIITIACFLMFFTMNFFVFENANADPTLCRTVVRANANGNQNLPVVAIGEDELTHITEGHCKTDALVAIGILQQMNNAEQACKSPVNKSQFLASLCTEQDLNFLVQTAIPSNDCTVKEDKKNGQYELLYKDQSPVGYTKISQNACQLTDYVTIEVDTKAEEAGSGEGIRTMYPSQG